MIYQSAQLCAENALKSPISIHNHINFLHGLYYRTPVKYGGRSSGGEERDGKGWGGGANLHLARTTGSGTGSDLGCRLSLGYFGRHGIGASLRILLV